jgi:hypothetical protein
MKLTAPSLWTFLSSLILVALLIASYFGLDLPILTAVAQAYPFQVMAAAWLLLFIGVMFNL